MEMTERGARFILGLMAILALLSLYLARPMLGAVILALITAFLLRGWQTRLHDKTGRPRLAAATLVTLTLLTIALPLIALVTLLIEELSQYASLVLDANAPNRITGLLIQLGIPSPWAFRGADLIMQAFERLGQALAQSALPTLIETTLGIFVYFFVLYYALIDGPRMLKFVNKAVPLRKERMDRLLAETSRALDAVFKGEILVAFIQGALATLGWWLFGLPDPLLWGLIMTILSIIPWTGAPLIIVPAGLWKIYAGHPIAGTTLILYGILLVGTIDNILRPHIIGRAGEIHPTIVLIGVLGGLTAFGLVGLFVGPLILVLLRATTIVWMEAAPNST